ncbi:chymotrypsin-like protease CTRL-1 [Nephila pilipes]|uniref:Chymotrypsin-like protease CTRL-1 n=1 Tax=Nephila pilipes TaxID=299642 RepID=A0A8X6U7V8_NEPPI|nr:chymotrypsin-like protease CTRL-1 [Nephila pilipes]
MLRLFIGICICGMIQAKAFPKKYKRIYDGNYNYDSLKEGFDTLQPEYNQNFYPYHQHYTHAYIPESGYKWSSVEHHPVSHQTLEDSNFHSKMKTKHTWHFIDENNMPINRYTEELYEELPIVVNRLTNKPPATQWVEYESPIVIEEKPVVVKEKPDYVDEYELPVVYHQTKKQITQSSEYESPIVIKEKPVVVKDKHDKDKPVIVKDKHDKEKPVIVKDKHDKEKPIVVKDKHDKKPVVVKEKPDYVDEYELPVVYHQKKKQVTQSSEFVKPIVKDKVVINKVVVVKEKPDKVVVVKEKPDKVEPIFVDEYGLPIVVGHSTKITQWAEHEMPFVKDKPIAIEEMPIKVDEYGLPTTKNHHIKQSTYQGVEYKMPIDKEKLVVVKKESHLHINKHELPIVDNLTKKGPVIEWSEYTMPVVTKEKLADGIESEHPQLESLNKVEDEEPVVVAALVRKEMPSFHDEDDETPIIVEALVQRPLKKDYIVDNAVIRVKEYKDKVVADPFIKEKPIDHKIIYEDTNKKRKESLPKDSTVKNENGIFNIPVERLDHLETPEEKRILASENFSRNKMEFENFDESDSGSALDIEVSNDAPRSLFPLGSSLETLLSRVRIQERNKFKSCITPKSETGHCMPFQLCSISIASNVDELLRNVCIIDDVFFGICCPEFPVETVRVDWGQFLKPSTDTFNDEKPTQIVSECGNLPSTIKEGDPWPWMASLNARSSDKIFCGGALISDQYVLTAAHCTIRIPRNQILIRLDHPDSRKSPEQDFEVVEIKRHAGYNPRTMENDIALLKLSKRVRLGDFRRLVCLADDDEDFVGKSASLLRWKGTLGEIGDVESLPVISNEECQTRLRAVMPDSILCAEPRTETMCNADSGAPLIIGENGKFKVIGILTWSRNDCDERFPTIFTKVSSFSRWIQNHSS